MERGVGRGVNTGWALADLIGNSLELNPPIELDSQVLASLGEQYAYSHQGSLAFLKHSGTDPSARAFAPKYKYLVDDRSCNIQYRQASPSAINDSITVAI